MLSVTQLCHKHVCIKYVSCRESKKLYGIEGRHLLTWPEDYLSLYYLLRPGTAGAWPISVLLCCALKPFKVCMYITNLSVAPGLNQLLINTLQRSCVCYMYHNISCSQTKPSLKGFYFPIFQTPVSEAHVLKALASKFLYGQYRQNQLSIISFTQRIVMTSWK